MIKQNERTLVNFARPAPNFPVLAAGTVVLICFGVGLVSTLSTQNYGLAGLFLLSMAGSVFLLWTNLNQWKRMTVGESNKNLTWEIELPESQRKKLNSEVLNLSKILEIPREQLSDLLSAYIVAEDLALRQIQQEARLPVLRHVQIGNVPFDGVLVKQETITCIEVTFLVTPNISQEKINLIMNKMAATQKDFKQLKIGAKMRLLLVLVTQLDQSAEVQLRSSLVKKFGSTTVDVDIRLLDFESLQKIYAID